MSISQSALVAHRKAIESLYDSIATIYSVTSGRNQQTGQTVIASTVLYHDKACRVSSKTDNQATSNELHKNKKQIVRLFISPDLSIPVGAKIDVVKNNVVTKYVNAGKSFVYDTHQEIILETE